MQMNEEMKNMGRRILAAKAPVKPPAQPSSPAGTSASLSLTPTYTNTTTPYTEESSFVNAMNHIDPIFWKSYWITKKMADYKKAHKSLKEAKAAIESEYTLGTLAEAEDLLDEGTKEVHTSYRWLKTSAKVLYRLLDRV